MYRWTILLRGQGIELPFRHIFGSFLIGRFIGTFLPSTAGLDGYKLYDAARFSGRTVEVTADDGRSRRCSASIGIFLSFLVALPFGINDLRRATRRRVAAHHGADLPRASSARCSRCSGSRASCSGCSSALPLPGKARLAGLVMRISPARRPPTATRSCSCSRPSCLSFVVHFTTAAMYYFTALAVGAVARASSGRWCFGSSIQIFATVLAPSRSPARASASGRSS